MAQVVTSSLPVSNSVFSSNAISDHDSNTQPVQRSSLNNQSSQSSSQHSPKKKKKASRACFHCQKAHLTCDDSRPCQRCVKRNLASSCKDGVRKRAKYLEEAQKETPELDLSKTLIAPNEMYNSYQMKPNYGFDSEALNLEYSMLSTMLANPNPTGVADAATWAAINEAPSHDLVAISNMMQRSPTMINTIPAISAIYHNPTVPFNYTEGFHYLLRYIRERMDKDAIMKICKAMALFRPSFIILIKNLTEEDLIFMEKSFQRITLEFKKLISFSGTPTVLWRRTGQIALVGKEFSLLTQSS
ncbi:Transcriptional regulator of nonfermentable carbon utilization, partial [Basidiobolus ranarum]